MAKRLYISNLPTTATVDDLVDPFSQCGEVKSVKIVLDPSTGQSKGSAYVEMATDEEADEVLESFNGARLDGHVLKIIESRKSCL